MASVILFMPLPIATAGASASTRPAPPVPRFATLKSGAHRRMAASRSTRPRRASIVRPWLSVPHRRMSSGTGTSSPAAAVHRLPLGFSAGGAARSGLAAGTGSTLENLTTFAGTSFATDTVPALPPDTQVAVGPTQVGEAVNSVLSVSTRAGAAIGQFDLNTFFSVPPGFDFSDPRLVFDRLSGRWLLSGFAIDAALDSNAYVAVSDSADATQGWFVQQVTAFHGLVSDQPKIGVSSDKVVMSWSDFDTTLSFVGQETWVLQKSELLSAAPLLHAAVLGPDGTPFAPVPVVALTAGTTAFVVYNNTCS